jgi:hypothetical protein
MRGHLPRSHVPYGAPLRRGVSEEADAAVQVLPRTAADVGQQAAQLGRGLVEVFGEAIVVQQPARARPLWRRRTRPDRRGAAPRLVFDLDARLPFHRNFKADAACLVAMMSDPLGAEAVAEDWVPVSGGMSYMQTTPSGLGVWGVRGRPGSSTPAAKPVSTLSYRSTGYSYPSTDHKIVCRGSN